MSQEQLDNMAKGMRKSCTSKVPVDLGKSKNLDKYYIIHIILCVVYNLTLESQIFHKIILYIL